MIIKVLQLNCQKKTSTTKTIFEKTNYDILLLQEPQLIKTELPAADSRWISIYDETSDQRIRAVTYINKYTKIPGMATKIPQWINSDMVALAIGNITLINVYNQKHGNTLFPEGSLAYFMSQNELTMNNTIIAGDYNLHHQEWQSDNISNNREAREAVEWLHSQNMQLCSTPDLPTHQSGSVIDLVYETADISSRIEYSLHQILRKMTKCFLITTCSRGIF